MWSLITRHVRRAAWQPLRRSFGAAKMSDLTRELDGETLVAHAETAGGHSDFALCSICKARFPAGPRQPGAFAIVKLGGTQHKVTLGDTIVAEKMPVDIGQELVLNEVLLVGTVHETLIGHPVIRDAKVVVHVDELTKDEKVIVFKKRRRKNSRRRRGFRRDLTLLRVVDIVADSLKLEHHPPPATPKYFLPKSEIPEDQLTDENELLPDVSSAGGN